MNEKRWRFTVKRRWEYHDEWLLMVLQVDEFRIGEWNAAQVANRNGAAASGIHQPASDTRWKTRSADDLPQSFTGPIQSI